MRVEQMIWTQDHGWSCMSESENINPHLILYFGTRQIIESGERYYELRDLYPDAIILGSSSGGEIINNEVHDNSIIASLIEFESTQIRGISINLTDDKKCFDAGKKIATALNDKILAGIFILSDGLNVNGTQLVQGLNSVIENKIPITGGLASDGHLFEQTLVGYNAPAKTHTLAAIGFYGSKIKIGHGSIGGWIPFGSEREVTRSIGRTLYELDGKPALDIYKQYLGEQSDKLPGSALLFPLSIRPCADPENTVVRAVLSIDEDHKSMTFAGDIPTGYIAQLMYGSFDSLIDGAQESASQAATISRETEQIGILVSCAGRRLLMGQSVNDELEAVYSFWNEKLPLTGFYSYGEISPLNQTGVCSFHNQTMTITTLGEG